MRRAFAVGQVLALAAAAFAHAQAADPLHSPECDAQRAALEHALDEAASKRAGAAERLAAVRKRAIETCLGPERGGRERVGAPDPPIVVPAPVIEAPRAPVAALPAPVAAPQPAVVVPRPAVITACDPGGCWDSEGHRLNSVGPMIVGPRGVCTLQGGLAHCP
jgi:hypothetical protein